MSELYIGKYWNWLRRQIKAEDRVLLAISGGADSIALFHLVQPSMDRLSQIAVANINHNTGQFADDAQKFVENIAKEAGVDFLTSGLSIPHVEIKEHGFEAAARIHRYMALRSLKSQAGASFIVTGHTLDDQAESLLISIMRGAGLKGMAGMKRRLEDILRPLLRVTHNDLVDFLNQNDLDFMEDPSNSDLAFTRNKVRKLLKPTIEDHFGQGSWCNLAYSASYLRTIHDGLEDLTEKAWHEVVHKRFSGWIMLDKCTLTEYFEELQVSLFRKAWQAVQLDDSRPEYVPRSVLESMLKSLEQEAGRTVQLVNRIQLKVTDTHLILDAFAAFPSITWQLPGKITLPDGSTVEANKRALDGIDGIRNASHLVEYLDRDICGDQFTIRPKQDGDRMIPLGRSGKMVKLTDLVDSENRYTPQWVAECNGEICYFIGKRIADTCRVTEKTEWVWAIDYTPPEEIL